MPDYMIKGGVTYRIITDHLGSPRLVVDAATGTVVQRMDYDEFGRVLARHQPRLPALRLRGRALRPAHRARALRRAGLRRRDREMDEKGSTGVDGGDTNLFGYVLGDPINLVDANRQFWLR